MTTEGKTSEKYQLRHYQEKAIDAVLEGFAEGYKRVLYVLPTGTGKTVVFSELVDRIRKSDPRPALIVAHREELLVQAAKTLRRSNPGITVGIEIGDQLAPRSSKVICASVQTIGRKGSDRLNWLKRIRPSVIIIDESQHSAAAGPMQVLREFGAFDEENTTLAVGCTATEVRLDGKAIHGFENTAFEKLVYRYPIRDAIKEGFLSDIRGYAVKGLIDLDGVRSAHGDFNQGQLAKAVNVESRNKCAIEHWKEICGNRKTIVFCVDVQHAHDVCEAFNKANVTCVTVNGAMKPHERKTNLKAFESGEAQVLTNVELATEGYDHPPISCVLLLRPTMSWGLFSQMVGRGTRICDGKKDVIVIDVTDNTSKHSLATIPTILGLPPQLDLQGKSLLEAAETVDELGDKAQHLPELLKKLTGKNVKQEELTFQDMRTVLHEINLLSELKKPTPISEYSRLAWIQTGIDQYRLSCGRSEDGLRHAILAEDIDGSYILSFFEGQSKLRQDKIYYFDDLSQLMQTVDTEVARMWPVAMKIARAAAGWRDKPATAAQIGLLKRLGVSNVTIDSMSAGDASRWIDNKIGKKANRPATAAR